MIALTVSVPFVFAGGDAGDFVRTVSAWSTKPAVVLIQSKHDRPVGMGGLGLGNIRPEWRPAESVKPFSLRAEDIADPKDFTRLIRLRTGLESRVAPEGVGLWAPAWEGETLHPRGEGLPPLPDGWKPAGPKAMKIEDGKATFAIPRMQAVQALQVAGLPWPKPVRTQWVLKRMWVVPAGTSAGERETLTALAAAVSGKLVETPDEFRIDFDVAAFRPRVMAHVAEGRPPDPATALDATRYAMVVQAWSDADDATLTRLFASDIPGFGLPVAPGSSLAVAMGRYLEAFRNWTFSPTPDMADAMGPYRNALGLIDSEGSLTIVLDQNLAVGAGWPRVGGGTVLL